MTQASESVAVMLFGLIALLGLGCDRSFPGQDEAVLTHEERKVIERQISFHLPADTKVLLSDDGDGRDAKVEYHLWLFYSRSGFVLTPENVPSASSYFPNRNVRDKAEWIQSLVKNRLPSGESASSISWSDGTYNFPSSLLRTEEGDYLSVQRFRKK